jgi:hypothetical protein
MKDLSHVERLAEQAIADAHMNAIIYGIGIMKMTTGKDGMKLEVVPVEEYEQLADHLKNINQNRIDK